MADPVSNLVKMFAELGSVRRHHHHQQRSVLPLIVVDQSLEFHRRREDCRSGRREECRPGRRECRGRRQPIIQLRFGTHHGRGPHGRNMCPPTCGYGWFPPAHCVGNYSWCEGRNGSVPHNAVRVGVDKDGGHIYAGRAFYEGDLLPAKVIPSHGCAFVPWGGREHQKYEYEVLCSVHVGWTTCSRGDIPPETICVGQTSNGERLYMGRVMHEGTLTPGKIQPSHGVLYIPYAGMEISYTEYEAMVLM